MTSLLQQRSQLPSAEALSAGVSTSALSFDVRVLQQLSFIPNLCDLLLTRQVHALEHATIWVLSGASPPLTLTATDYRSYSLTRSDNGQLSGFSTPQGFYLTGDVSPQALRRASAIALKRLNGGEWDLAIHPRCGTNLPIALTLTAGAVVAAHLALPRRPLDQILGFVGATALAAAIAPAVGAMAQKYVTTAVPTNLAIDGVYPVYDGDPEPQNHKQFVRVRWVD
ncbi:MAG: DUF6391 domain-containing protein [Elainellaceae cyanobacterium]